MHCMCLPCRRQALLSTLLPAHGFDVLLSSCAALLFKLKQKAMQECKEAAQAYAQCCSGRVFSAVWSCRGELSDLNRCLHQQCACAIRPHCPAIAPVVHVLCCSPSIVVCRPQCALYMQHQPAGPERVAAEVV